MHNGWTMVHDEYGVTFEHQTYGGMFSPLNLRAHRDKQGWYVQLRTTSDRFTPEQAVRLASDIQLAAEAAEHFETLLNQGALHEE